MTLGGLALRQLRARPLRAVLTVVAVSFSVGLLSFLVLLNEALKNDFSPFVGQRVVVIAKTGFFDKIPMAYLAKIEATPGVLDVAPFDFLIGSYRDDRPENQVPVSASPVEHLLNVYKEAKLSEPERAAFMADPTGAMIGKILVKKYGWKVGDRIVLKAPVKGGVVEATVRAVMQYDLDNGVYIHRRYFEGLSGNEGQAAMFWILARTRDDVVPVTLAIDKAFTNAPVPIQAMTEKQWQLSFMQMLGNVKALLGSIGLATAFALLLITGNTLAMAARERRGQAALLRILGFQKGIVAGLLLVEAAIYGILGAVLGMGLASLFGKVLNRALETTAMAGIGSLLKPNATVAVLSLGIAILLTVGAGLIPSLSLTRRSIVQLLRDAA